MNAEACVRVRRTAEGLGGRPASVEVHGLDADAVHLHVFEELARISGARDRANDQCVVDAQLGEGVSLDQRRRGAGARIERAVEASARRREQVLQALVAHAIVALLEQPFILDEVPRPSGRSHAKQRARTEINVHKANVRTSPRELTSKAHIRIALVLGGCLGGGEGRCEIRLAQVLVGPDLHGGRVEAITFGASDDRRVGCNEGENERGREGGRESASEQVVVWWLA